MTTKLKRKRVKNIRLINSKTYGNAALKVKWYMGATERSWGLNRDMGKHRACTIVSLHGSSSSSCAKHRSSLLAARTALTSPSCKCNRWSTSAAMCWQEALYFLSLTLNAADPRNYKPHQLKSMISQKLICIHCLPPHLQPLTTSGRKSLWEPGCSWWMLLSE